MPTILERKPNSPPLHIQIASLFRERIVNGTWQDGASLPPETALCAEFDVARGTIRQALQTLEAEGLLRREQGRGTFIQLVRHAQTNGKLRTGHFAFVVPYVRDSSVSTVLVGFQQVAERAGYAVLFNHVNNDVAQQEQAIKNLVAEGIDGIALYPVDSEHANSLETIMRPGLPVVMIDRYLKALSTDYVMSDHFGGAIRAATYLLDNGHRHVGFVTWLSPAVSMEHRFLGYMQALRERGIEPVQDDVCYVNGYPTFDLTPLVAYLSRPDRPTAIFAANDQIAIATYRAAASVGLSIPEDLAVIGFDNLDISPHLDPPLTTMAQPFLEIGQTAANVLLRRIEGDDTGYLQQITLAPVLMERGSCIPLKRE